MPPVGLITAAGAIINPQVPQADLAVAPNFERFDGLAPLAPPVSWERTAYYQGGPRPGESAPTALVYTPGPLSATVGTVGGQPLSPIVGTRILRGPGGYTPSVAPTVQYRLGVGQAGPSALGAAQTVQLSEITNAPPVPGDLSAIIAGQS